MPEISVIVPVYNVEAYLPQCIDSIRCQTLSDIEIICVVDGSTDRSEMILRLFEKAEPRIRIIEKENGGLSSARNAGIDASCSPILMFVDSDDLLEPNACQVVSDAFAEHDAEILTFGANCYPEFDSTNWYERTLSPKHVHYGRFDPAIIFDEASSPFVWRTAIKASFIERVGLRFDEKVKFGEDVIFQLEAYPLANGISFISDKLYNYRIARKGSLMDTRFANELVKLSEHISICDSICAFWKEHGLMEPYKTQLLDWAASFLMESCMPADANSREVLIPQLSAFLRKWFTMDQVQTMQSGEPVQHLCALLIKGAENADEMEQSRVTYLKSANLAENEQGRSTLANGLRRVLPMTALGLEERLERIELQERRIQWAIEDSAKCTRCLELLRCELAAKGAL